MISKRNSILSLSLTILMLLSLISIGEGFAQSVRLDPIDLVDLKEIDKCFQERDLLNQINTEKTKTIAELEKNLALEKKGNELNEREILIQKRMLEVKENEIQATRRSLNDMKEVTDRAIKLAETAKPKSNWELLGVIGALLFIGGMVVGGL